MADVVFVEDSVVDAEEDVVEDAGEDVVEDAEEDEGDDVACSGCCRDHELLVDACLMNIFV